MEQWCLLSKIPTCIHLLMDKANRSYYIETDLKCAKWLVRFSYNLYKNRITSHFTVFKQKPRFHFSKFQNIMVLKHLNPTLEETALKIFFVSFLLKSIVKEPTCSEYQSNASCTNLILINKIRRI